MSKSKFASSPSTCSSSTAKQSFRNHFESGENCSTKPFTPVEGEFAFASIGDTPRTRRDPNSPRRQRQSLLRRLNGQDVGRTNEESGYEPIQKISSQLALKIKKDYLSGIGDSLDLVVLGAYYGKANEPPSTAPSSLPATTPAPKPTKPSATSALASQKPSSKNSTHKLKDIVIDRPKPFYSHSTGNQRPTGRVVRATICLGG